MPTRKLQYHPHNFDVAKLETLLVRQSGLRDWQSVSDAMHHYTDQRNDQSRDEIWLVEHPPVFTQGQAGKAEHLLMPGEIPGVQSDRGGQPQGLMRRKGDKSIATFSARP